MRTFLHLAQPYFTQKPDKFPSGDVTFAEILRSCKAAGFPPPEITWVKYVLKVNSNWSKLFNCKCGHLNSFPSFVMVAMNYSPSASQMLMAMPNKKQRQWIFVCSLMICNLLCWIRGRVSSNQFFARSDRSCEAIHGTSIVLQSNSTYWLLD